LGQELVWGKQRKGKKQEDGQNVLKLPVTHPDTLSDGVIDYMGSDEMVRSGVSVDHKSLRCVVRIR
jgi:hypothetical protein